MDEIIEKDDFSSKFHSFLFGNENENPIAQSFIKFFNKLTKIDAFNYIIQNGGINYEVIDDDIDKFIDKLIIEEKQAKMNDNNCDNEIIQYNYYEDENKMKINKKFDIIIENCQFLSDKKEKQKIISSFEDTIIWAVNSAFNMSLFYVSLLISNNEHRKMIIDFINELINELNQTIYRPPYEILFGRIKINKVKSNEFKGKEIDERFYEGFGLCD